MLVRIRQFLGNFGGAGISADRVARLPLAVFIFLQFACGAPAVPNSSGQGGTAPSSREITIALWAGLDEKQVPAGSPTAPIFIQRGPVSISGPISSPHPVSGEPILTYERTIATPQGPRRQLLSQTHDGAGLGRILFERPNLPTRRFTGDLIFPLGVWTEGERRSFLAMEYTDLGAARRLVSIVIPRIDFPYRNIPHSMAYILTIEDAAGRILACERYVYSPGIGLAAFETDGVGPGGSSCNACPCPLTQSG